MYAALSFNLFIWGSITSMPVIQVSKMNDLKKSLLLAAAVTLIQNIAHIGMGTSDMTGFLICRMNYTYIVLNEANMLQLCMQMFPVIVFEIMFGVYLYRHFCTACVYYFSRQDNRIRWFVKECGRLLAYTFSYWIFSALLNIAAGVFVFHVPISGYDAEAIFYMVALPALYTFIFTLWVNVLSVILGGANAAAIMAGIQYLFTFAIMLSNRELTLHRRGTWKLYLNPVANMVQDWHSDVAGIKGKLEDSFFAWYSLLYYIVVATATIVISTLIIRKQDISLENKEERG